MLQYDLQTIQHGLSSNQIVLRITDGLSITPLTDLGFTASSTEFQPSTSGRAWKRDYHHMRGNRSWLRDRDVLEGMVAHITGGWGSIPSPSVSNIQREMEGSKWISTSGDLDWTIFEISRRLTVLRKDIKEVRLTVVRRYGKISRRYQGVKDIEVDPLLHLNKFLKSRRSYGNREKVQKAINFANVSGEVLFLGKKFGKDILESTVWTRDSTGLDLPTYMLKPREQWRANQSWMDRLIWDPSVHTSFTEVKKIIEENKRSGPGPGPDVDGIVNSVNRLRI
ncbi:hypothetical protein I302_106748 [Kwoniella bestiolae CBS 10118]|uniref:Uncharacterized protein n=1 Tax=Kwoniella bestiolae CBS 10118 TaxID=1296100 RepID=A0A1B9G0J0_9TREE|nr:hypothetical protein I302_05986 [Kwoniella bestiolae CBS 10118]OCF24526.1 hypothetical protein I302_05986 [Kwoniella bestiolae CBS 10118]